eukprot:gene9148-1445_t
MDLVIILNSSQHLCAGVSEQFAVSVTLSLSVVPYNS